MRVVHQKHPRGRLTPVRCPVSAVASSARWGSAAGGTRRCSGSTSCTCRASSPTGERPPPPPRAALTMGSQVSQHSILGSFDEVWEHYENVRQIGKGEGGWGRGVFIPIPCSAPPQPQKTKPSLHASSLLQAPSDVYTWSNARAMRKRWF